MDGRKRGLIDPGKDGNGNYGRDSREGKEETKKRREKGWRSHTEEGRGPREEMGKKGEKKWRIRGERGGG
jgi:hypothetical protein